MKHENLANLLKSQALNLNELLLIMKDQQTALVNNNHESLEDSIKKEELIFSQINRVQKTILAEIKRIDEIEGLRLIEYKLSELIRSYVANGNTDAKSLMAIQKHIVKTIKEISRVNFQNNFLIDHARELIREIITTAVKDKNAIFDRRV